MSIRIGIFAICGLFVALAVAAEAEHVWVSEDNVQIRQGEGAVYPIVAAAKKGTELTVISRDRKWLMVSANSSQGYVYEDSISHTPVSGGGGSLIMTSSTDADSSVLSSGSATRGLQPETANGNQSANVRAGRPLLEKMIADRSKIKPETWEAFTAEGHVGPHAP